MVKRAKMQKYLLLLAVLLTFVSPSPAQNVMAVDHYITDTAPVAGIGVGEAARGFRPQTPHFPEPPISSFSSRGSDSRHTSSFVPEQPPLPRDVDRTVTYVEDVLAGRRDVSEGAQDAVFEPQERRTSPVSSGGYSKVGAPSSASRTGDEESRDRPVATSHSSRDPGGTMRRPIDEGSRTVVSGSPREASRSSGVDAGYSRDDMRPVTPSRIVPVDSGSNRRPQDGERISSGVANARDSDRPHSATNPPLRRTDTGSDVISSPGRQRDELPDSRYDGGSSSARGSSVPARGSSVPARGSSVPVHGSSIPSRGSPVPDSGPSVPSRSSSVPSRGSSDPERDYSGGSSASSSNKRGYSTEDEESPYRRNEASTISNVPSRDAYSGSDREESRDPISLSSQDLEVNPYLGTVPERNRDTTVSRFSDDEYENSRVASTHNLRDHVSGDDRGTSSGFSRGTSDVRSPAYDNSHHTSSDHVDDELREHLRETMIPNSRDTLTGGIRDTVVVRPTTSTINHHRDTNIGSSHDTVVSHPRETVVEDPRRTPVGPHPSSVDDYSRPTYVDNSGESISHKSTTPGYHREPATSNSRDHGIDENKSDHDSDFARPMEFPRGESVEEPIYSSRNQEDLEASFGFDSAEEDEDIDGAHSSRPLPKTQKPRQVTATQERRGARGPHPASPCPSVFSYEGTRAGRERWYGVVLITTTETLTGVRLEVTLDKKADLLGAWLGEVSSLDNIHYTIWNGRRKVNPGPPLSVKIFVKYNNAEYEPPRIRTIRLNGRQICPKDKASPMPAPTRPPPRPNPPGKRPTSKPTQSNRPAGQKPRPQATTRPQSKPTTSNAGAELVDGVACGRIDVQPTPLITYGQRTSRGQWPWHAAIYQSKGTDLSYICGGSLIGKRTVLTAAHCVSRRYVDRPIDPETLVVYLGKYNLKLWSEGGVQDKQVAEIHVHPEYNSTDFRADIAILMLSSPVEFSVYVKPICLWDKNRPGLNEIEGQEGVVVGWGYDETGTVTDDLMMAKMPVVSQETCIWSYPQFFSHFTSDRTYCAGFRNGTSVCNGDSGGGMVFPKSTGIGPHGAVVTWALRGLVSLSTSQANKRICNTEHYVVFTDVVKFYSWMHKYM